jgi:hypothetical protein
MKLASGACFLAQPQLQPAAMAITMSKLSHICTFFIAALLSSILLACVDALLLHHPRFPISTLDEGMLRLHHRLSQ